MNARSWRKSMGGDSIPVPYGSWFKDVLDRLPGKAQGNGR
jgi:hypothetical protein